MVGGISGVGSFGMGSVGRYYQSRLTENIRNMRSAQQTGQGQVWTARKTASPETPVEPVKAVRPVSRNDASLPDLTARLENDPAAMAGRMRTRYGQVSPDGLFVETGKEGLSPVDGSRKSALEGRLFQAEEALGRNDLEGAEDVLSNGAPQAEADKLPGLPGQENEQDAPALPGQEKDENSLDGKAALGAESAQEALEEGKCETCEKRKYQDGSDDMGVSFQTPTNIKPEVAASAVRGHEMEHVYREQAKADREGRKVVSQSVTMHTEICPECGKSFVSGGTTHTVTKADTESDLQQDLARQNQDEEKTRTPFSAVA